MMMFCPCKAPNCLLLMLVFCPCKTARNASKYRQQRTTLFCLQGKWNWSLCPHMPRHMRLLAKAMTPLFTCNAILCWPRLWHAAAAPRKPQKMSQLCGWWTQLSSPACAIGTSQKMSWLRNLRREQNLFFPLLHDSWRLLSETHPHVSQRSLSFPAGKSTPSNRMGWWHYSRKLRRLPTKPLLNMLLQWKCCVTWPDPEAWQ